MAEGGAKQHTHPTAKVNLVCKYYICGVCSKGSNCIYLHDKSKGLPMDNICKYYQYGSCTYGDKCRYDHVKKDKKTPTRTEAPKRAAPLQSRVPSLVSQEATSSHMVTLRKGGIDQSLKESQRKKEKEEKWAQAKSFVPGQKYHGSAPGSYAQAIGANSQVAAPAFNDINSDHDCWESPEGYAFDMEPTGIGGLSAELITEDTPLCPFYAVGSCQYEECLYAHGDICDMCGMPQLHPVDKKQRDEHIKACLAEHERDMEHAFAVQASQGQECGICLEDVLSKESDPRFGILENCNHCFCLKCIRQWRGNNEIAIETHRSCPTCRTHSNFITPSKYWVTTSEEKSKLIQDYKKALGAKPCQYFKKGKGECPFNTKCFYLHALEDNTKVEANIVKRRWRTNADGEQAAQDEELSLWDFINSRDTLGLDAGDEELSLLLEILQAGDSSGDSDYD